MRPSVTSCYSLRHKVRLLPAGLPVDVPELLVLPHGEEHLAGELDHPAAVLGPLPGDVHQAVHPASLQQGPGNILKLKYPLIKLLHFNFKFILSANYLENSGCFLITSLRVASTAAMVSSEVPWSLWGFPLGSFCTRSRMAYFPGK